MRLDWPLAKFCLKSDLNFCLIDIFDPNSWSLIELLQQNQLYLVQFFSKKSIYIKNRSHLIKNGQKHLGFWLILTNLIKFNHFQSNNQHWHIYFWSFNQKMIKTDQNWSIIIKIRSNFGPNRDCWYDLVVEIQIGPKSTNWRWLFHLGGLMALAYKKGMVTD